MEKLPALNTRERDSRRESLREQLFAQLLAQRILESFDEKMKEGGLEEDTLQEIHTTFAALSEEDKKAVLAVPAQLQVNLFSKYAEQVDDGKMTGSDIVSDLLGKSKKYGFTLGYHLSPTEIKPEKDGEWVVKGTEKDHRHNDTPMAYYSMDYQHRYLKKPMQWLYVVRAETKDSSGHYQDNNGAWGHAPSLAIVDSADIFELDKQIEQQVKDLEATKEKRSVAESNAPREGSNPSIDSTATQEAA